MTATPFKGRPRIVLRHIGAAATTLALVALGLAAGLALGSPASAAPSDTIDVMMTDHGETTYSPVAAFPLLDVADLAPGASVTGNMKIRDNSGNDAGSNISDELRLDMINIKTSDDCANAAPAASCTDSGDTLRDAVRFAITVDGASVQPSATVPDLENGVILQSGLRHGDELPLTVTASIPGAAGNAIQYGTLTFNLQLGLTSGGETQTSENGPPPSSGQQGEPSTNPDSNIPGGSHARSVEVSAVSSQESGAVGGTEASGTTEQTRGSSGGSSGVLVLGTNKNLPYTGAPITMLLTVGGFVLAVGLVLLAITRRRRSPH